MAFASVSNLATYLNRTLSAGEQAQATMMLTQATEAIKAEVHQSIELVEDDEVVLRGNWGAKLTLPERPVTAVTAVDIEGTVLADDVSYTWDGVQTLYRGNWSIISGQWAPYPHNAGLFWGGDMAQVTVTYSHGLDVTDPKMDVIRGVCLAMVKRGMDSPGGGVTQQSETLGPYSHSETFASVSGGSIAMNPAERRIVRKVMGR